MWNLYTQHLKVLYLNQKRGSRVGSSALAKENTDGTLSRYFKIVQKRESVNF